MNLLLGEIPLFLDIESAFNWEKLPKIFPGSIPRT